MPETLSLTVDPENPEEKAIARAVEVLRAGGIVAYPTETFYGLAVDPRDARALARLSACKGRDAEKAFPWILSGLEDLDAVALDVTPEALALARTFWPGPLTLVVAVKPDCAAPSAARDGSVALRVSSSPLARRLSRALGAAITATSANRSGSPPARTAAEVVARLGAKVDLVLDGGPAPGGMPSTIVDVRSGSVKLVREGAIPFSDVLAALPDDRHLDLDEPQK